MPNNRRKEGKRQKPSNNPKGTSGSPSMSIQIPNPLTVRHEPTTEDNQRYAEESHNRGEQLTTAKRLNWITGIGVAVAGFGLLGVVLTIRQSDKAMRLDERAWVGVYILCAKYPGESGPLKPDGGCVDPKPDEEATNTVVYFKNFWKTPALNVRTLSGWNSEMENIPPEIKLEAVSPNDTLFPSMLQNISPNLSSDLAKEIRNRPHYGGRVHGFVWYDDIFGKHHWTRFCFIIADQFRAYIPCEKYNSTDESEMKQPWFRWPWT